MTQNHNDNSKPVVIFTEGEELKPEKLAAYEKSTRGRCLLFSLLDYGQPELSRHVWELMNHGLNGVAISCNRLQKDSIKLTSRSMMQMFRMLEDRDAYLLVSFGADDEYFDQMKSVVTECTRLRVILGNLG